MYAFLSAVWTGPKLAASKARIAHERGANVMKIAFSYMISTGSELGLKIIRAREKLASRSEFFTKTIRTREKLSFKLNALAR